MIPAGFFVFLTAVSYVLHSVMMKYASGKADPYTGIFVWSCGVFLIGLLSFCYGRFSGEAQISLVNAPFLIVAGCAITIGSLGYLLAFQRGVEFSFATPLVNISVVAGGILFGLLLFGEHISLMRVFGAFIGAVSIVLLVRS